MKKLGECLFVIPHSAKAVTTVIVEEYDTVIAVVEPNLKGGFNGELSSRAVAHSRRVDFPAVPPPVVPSSHNNQLQ